MGLLYGKAEPFDYRPKIKAPVVLESIPEEKSETGNSSQANSDRSGGSKNKRDEYGSGPDIYEPKETPKKTPEPVKEERHPTSDNKNLVRVKRGNINYPVRYSGKDNFKNFIKRYGLRTSSEEAYSHPFLRTVSNYFLMKAFASA